MQRWTPQLENPVQQSVLQLRCHEHTAASADWHAGRTTMAPMCEGEEFSAPAQLQECIK